jgi:glyoxylase-like metal-dependent hydrolase (beta-lactamase superfamily II)
VVTKLKSGNRQQNIETLLALRSSFQNDAKIHPGHGPEMMAHDLRDEHFPDLLKESYR